MKENYIAIFLSLARCFKAHGFNLYMVGGSTRDYLLNRNTKDLDLATDALVNEMKEFLENYKTPFARMGNLKLVIDGVHIDITTLRLEKDYQDSRHPNTITFVKDLSLDAKRRDFTINAIYLDQDLKTHDFYGGIDDLQHKCLRMIGDPMVRLAEDPLRVFRALRFHLSLGFSLESNLQSAIQEVWPLVAKLNPQKVQEELQKMAKSDPNYHKRILTNFQIDLNKYPRARE